MFTTDFRRQALSTIGALFLSTLCVIAAVGPAKASNPTTEHSCPGTIAIRV
jgi:hypothetical protein